MTKKDREQMFENLQAKRQTNAPRIKQPEKPDAKGNEIEWEGDGECQSKGTLRGVHVRNGG